MTSSAKSYICWIVALGSVAVFAALSEWQFTHTVRFPVYFALAVVTSTFKMRFPAITVSCSSNSLFIILGAAELDATEAMLVACAAAAAQTLLNTREKPSPVQLGFNMAVLGIATSACIWTSSTLTAWGAASALALFCAGVVFYVLNTILISGIVALTREITMRRIWRAWLCWTTPAFVVSTAAAMALFASDPTFRWRPALLTIPLAVILQMGYRRLVEARIEVSAWTAGATALTTVSRGSNFG